MKIFTSIKRRAKNFLLLLVMLLSSSWAWGDVYEYTFTKKIWSGNGDATLGDVVWTLDNDGGYYAYNSTKGHQIGKADAPATYISISTTGISGVISSITVNTSGASGINANLAVKVGGNAFGGTVSLTQNATEYTFSGSASGAIDLVWTNNSAKAIYVKSISVTYSEAVADKVLAPYFTPADGSSFIDNQTIVANCATDGVTIHYTIDGSVPTSASSVFPVAGLTISETTTINAIAVKDGYDDSDVVSATYTKLNVFAIVAEKNGAFYAMSDDIESSRLNAEEVNAVNGKVIKETWSKTIYWNVDQSAGTIISLNGKYVTFTGTSTNLKLGDSEYNWQWNAETGYWTVITEPTRMLALYSGKTPYYFKAYKEDPGYAPAITMPFVDGYVRTVTPEKFGTICLPCAVAAEDIAGATFYSIAGKRTEAGVVKTLVLTEETTLQAGVPYLFCATADKLVVAYNGAATTASTSNGLVGSLTGQDVAEDMYILTNNTIKQCGTGCTIGANRAYIDMAAVSEFGGALGVNQRMISLDGETAIDDVMNLTTDRVDVYTMSGVRVRHQVPVADATNGLSAGLYVVGTKKVVVK